MNVSRQRTEDWALTPSEEAMAAGLIYVDASLAGYTRRRQGASFRYFNASGRPVRSPGTIKRFNSLAIRGPSHVVNGVNAEDVHAELIARFGQRSYPCLGATAAFAREDYRVGLYDSLGSAAAAAGLARDLVRFINEQKRSLSKSKLEESKTLGDLVAANEPMQTGSLYGPHRIAPQHGVGFTMRKGQTLRVTDPEGEQVADLIAFGEEDWREGLSSESRGLHRD